MLNHIDGLEPRRLMATITGRVYHDLNGDGVTQTTEPSLAGGTVYVDFNNDGKRQTTEPGATSNSNGAYAISSSAVVTGKSYVLRLIQPSGYNFAASRSVFVGAATTKAPDLGTWKYAKITLSAYLDANNNGKPDTGEPPLNTVTYWDDANVNFKQDANEPTYGPGTVTLTLRPGQHEITASSLIGYRKTGYIDIGGTFYSGQTVASRPFGYYYPARYSGHVYQDKNKNGKFDAGEGVGGRRVFADANNNNHQDEDEAGNTTAADGSYYVDLRPGTYTIRQLTIPGWTTTATRSVTVKASSYATTPGYDLATSPSAVATTGTITGSFYSDVNGNGKQDAGEGVFAAEMVVYIDYNHNGNEDNDDLRGTANSDGTFVFSNVRPGTYQVRASPWGENTQVTSSYKTATVTAGQTTAISGFGVRQLTRVSIAAFIDTNQNGKWDVSIWGNDPSKKISGDDEAPGRIIYIDANNNGMRDAAENYIETNRFGPSEDNFLLAAGTYTFRQEIPAGYKQTGRDGYGLTAAATFNVDGKLRLPGDAPSGTAMLYFLTVLDTSLPDPKTAKIHGWVFSDDSKDGQWNGIENTVPNQVLYLDTNNNGTLDAGEKSVTGDPYGEFTFTGLAAGTYRVRLKLASGYVESTPPVWVTLARTQVGYDVFLGRRLV